MIEPSCNVRNSLLSSTISVRSLARLIATSNDCREAYSDGFQSMCGVRLKARVRCVNLGSSKLHVHLHSNNSKIDNSV